MDAQKVIEFADAICEDARGDVAKMNRIAVNKSLKFYLDNVVMLGTLPREVFMNSYPEHMGEIERVMEAAEKARVAEEEHINQGTRIAALEAKLDKLTAALEKFMESEQATEDETDEEAEPEPEPKPRKRRASKAKNSDAAAEETDSEADDDASDTESES